MDPGIKITVYYFIDNSPFSDIDLPPLKQITHIPAPKIAHH